MSAKAVLRPVAPGLHVAEAPQRFLGLEVGARMTVIELGGGLLVHSPIALPPAAVAHLGNVRWVLAPNKFHHLHAGPWAEAGAELWAAPGVAEKRPGLRVDNTLTGEGTPFGPGVVVHPLRCLPMSNEVVVLHRPSRTLIVTDLVFNFTPSAPWLTRAVMSGLGGYPGCCTTLLERAAMRRDLARQDLATIASFDFDRLIMAHGAIIEQGGKAALLGAFGWLGSTARLGAGQGA